MEKSLKQKEHDTGYVIDRSNKKPKDTFYSYISEDRIREIVRDELQKARSNDGRSTSE